MRRRVQNRARAFPVARKREENRQIESTKTEAGDRVYQVRKWEFRIEVQIEAATASVAGPFLRGAKPDRALALRYPDYSG